MASQAAPAAVSAASRARRLRRVLSLTLLFALVAPLLLLGKAGFTLAVVILVFVGMVKEWGSPDVLLLSGTLACTAAGILTPDQAFRGFSNEGMLTVGALFVVAAAMRETGALEVVGARMMGRARTAEAATLRLGLSVGTMSAFLNNTPIVAMMLPIVTDWCRKHQVSPSRLLIPLSFFTILGGMCTLIGTSTNLVVRGLMIQAAASQTDARLEQALRAPTLFEVSVLGVPLAIAGGLYLLVIGKRLLPDRKGLIEQLGETSREYLVDMLVQPGCRLIGKSVEEAGLRRLEGLFLIEIQRGERVISPVSPDELIRAGDRLTFTGVVTSIVELERIPGLVPAADDSYETRDEVRRGRRLAEAVISPRSPLIGKTIRDADFRALYNAAIVAVHRGGTRLRGRIGDIVLHAGDTLLLQCGAHFARAHRNNGDFILVSSVEESRPIRRDRGPLALGLLIVLVLLMMFSGETVRLGAAAFRVPEIVVTAFVVALLLIGTRCIATSDALGSVDWQTLIGIAASFGLGKALETSGAADLIANLVVRGTGGLGPVAVLAAIYLVTMVLTEMVSNNAAAALMLPLGIAAAANMGVNPRPFAFAVMFGATLAFATPIGYQTNLMVYGPGAYRFTDFTRVGLPLNILLWILAVILIPIVWPFQLP
jgi:di/tricarboxylate transporter